MTAFEALTSSESNDWYTPSLFTDMARQVMGGIDIDPASNDEAQQWIRAATYYTIAQDGFSKPWKGRLWLNPPYGIKSKDNLGANAWIAKAIVLFHAGELTQAVLLVRGDSHALKTLQRIALCCEPDKRIAFIHPGGEPSKRPVPGCRFYYLGDRQRDFYQVFSQIGVVSRAVQDGEL